MAKLKWRECEPTTTPWERPGFYWWARLGRLCYVEQARPVLGPDDPVTTTVSVFSTRIANRPSADRVYGGQSLAALEVGQNTDVFYPVLPPDGVELEDD